MSVLVQWNKKGLEKRKRMRRKKSLTRTQPSAVLLNLGNDNGLRVVTTERLNYWLHNRYCHNLYSRISSTIEQ